MRAIVTGAAGFIGSTLSERLLSEGWTVTGVDCLTDYYSPIIKRQNIAEIMGKPNASRFSFVEQDLTSIDWNEFLPGVDVVFHQAGQPGVRKSWGSDFSTYVSANIDATQRLLEAVVEAGSLSRLVYASSSSVYGDAEMYPTQEDVAPRPRSPYGVTKLAAEHLCSLYAANYGLPTVSLRYFTVFGPRQRPDMAFTRFLRAARDGGTISLYGDGEQIRDFTYVDDIVDANLRAATAAISPGSVFNACGGSSVSVNEVLQWIEAITGRRLEINRLPAVAGDVRRTGGDSTFLRTATGWRPRTDVREGLERQWSWISAVDRPDTAPDMGN